VSLGIARSSPSVLSSGASSCACVAMRLSSWAISSGGRTKSTLPPATAFRGMAAYLADFSSCAKVTPPIALMACKPSVPSEAVLDDYKCHAGVRRQCSQQLREGFKAAGRCADTHDGEWCFTILAGPRLRGLPVVPAFRTAASRPPGFLRHSYLRNGHYPPVKR